MDGTDLEVKTSREVVALTCTKTGRIFYGTDNGQVREIIFKDRIYLGITINQGRLMDRKNKEKFEDRLWGFIPVKKNIKKTIFTNKMNLFSFNKNSLC